MKIHDHVTAEPLSNKLQLPSNASIHYFLFISVGVIARSVSCPSYFTILLSQKVGNQFSRPGSELSGFPRIQRVPGTNLSSSTARAWSGRSRCRFARSRGGNRRLVAIFRGPSLRGWDFWKMQAIKQREAFSSKVLTQSKRSQPKAL